MKLFELTTKVGPLEYKARKEHATAIVDALKKIDQTKYSSLIHKVGSAIGNDEFNIHFLMFPRRSDYRMRVSSLINKIADAKITLTNLLKLRKDLEREIK